MSALPFERAPTAPFGLSADEFRTLGHQAVELVAGYLAGIPEKPVFTPLTHDERNALLPQELPDRGVSPEQTLAFIRDHILTHPMGNGHPRYFAWVNSPPAMLAVVTELFAAAMNPSCAGGDHAAIYLERCAVRWLMELVGYPVGNSMGLLVSGGSMASLTALAAARHWAAAEDGWSVRREGLQNGHARLVLYLSEEGHSCLRKAAELMGLGTDAIHTVPVDENYRMDSNALRAAIAADRTAGLRPFCVAASAGTVNTGAIDRLDVLADICAQERLWLHVDGAYGAFGILDEALRPRYCGLERAHSLALDPHKWLSVPVECGCVFVRDGALLRDTFSLVPPYLRTEESSGSGGLPWYSEYGFQQTRAFRALKLWATIQQAGRRGLREMVERHNRLARQLKECIEQADDLELLAPVELSIVCFRYRPSALGGNEQQLDILNKRLLGIIQAEGQAFLSSTTVRGRFSLRACILHFGTTGEDIAALVATVRQVGERLCV